MSDHNSDSSRSSTDATDGESNGINKRAQSEYKEEIVRDMAIEKMREKMEAIVQHMQVDYQRKLDLLMDDLVGEVKLFNLRNYELRQLFKDSSSSSLESKAGHKSHRPRRVGGNLPDKVFVARNSLLTDLFEVKHIKTIYHIFVVTLIIMFLNTVVHDFVDSGSINLGFRTIATGFRRIHIGLAVWGAMQLSVLSVYAFFGLWAYSRKYIANSDLRKLWDICWIAGYMLFQCCFTTRVITAVLLYDFPPPLSVAILMEMVRFTMKVHAFVRSNIPRALASTSKLSSEDKPVYTTIIPAFSKYLYFLFAPTLVYRDEYPRTKRIRWAVVFRHALEVVGVIFYIGFIFERLLMPLFDRFGDAQISSGKFVLTLFGCIMPGSLCFLCGFYCLLHAWLNGSSELLRFADRMFYSDWWNASSFSEYIRSWNLVVHDWLYAYIYKDSVEHLFKRCRPLATVLVFTISAIFHEVIMAFSFRFFYPVMFVQFEFMGLLLMFVTRNLSKDFGNVLLWLALCVGNGIQLSLYNMEYYARRNCPVSGESLIDYMIPVSWTCNGISHNPNWTITAPWDI